MTKQLKSVAGLVSVQNPRLRLKPLVCVLIGLFCAPALAQVPSRGQTPTGGVVTAGQANISQSGSVTTINQTTNRAAIKWNSFDVGQDAKVNFVQPDRQAVTLNRVDSMAPSQIYGQIQANGQVYLMNPAGIYFAPGASVDVGGIVATTHQMTDAEFMQGKTTFTRNGAKGSVLNEGKIETDLGGYVALLAPEVRNKGFILARQGTVAMAGGETITLNFGPLNKLESVTVTAGDLAALVENQQAVQAPGGLVIMSARAINQLASRVVNTGVIEAKGLSDQGGRIVLDAGSTGSTVVAGVLDVSSDQARGGRIEVTGDQVQVRSGARLDASGSTGGGEVLVGGGWQGQDASIRQATNTSIEAGAVLAANATNVGDGGTVVAWSDIKNPKSSTSVKGTLEAKGGVNAGQGGKIETSGYQVDIAGAQISAEAPKGRGGLWLIDPYDYVIGATEAVTIVGSLNAGTSVTVDTSVNNAAYGSNGVSTSAGNITISSAINKTTGGNATLTLNAANNIVISAGISSLGNQLDLVLNSAGSSGVVSGVLALNSGSLTKQGAGTIKLTANNTYTGATTISAGSLIFENDAPNIVTSGFSGAGSLTIQPASASFTSALTLPAVFGASSLGGLTIGKSTNTAALTVQNNISIAGPITLYGGDVTFNAQVSTSTGDILVRSSGVTTIASGKQLSTTNGNIVLTTAQLVNNSNSTALNPSGSGKYWQVWSTNASPFTGAGADVLGGLSFDYVQYAASYGSTTVLGSGRGLLYSYAPTVGVSLTGTTTKVYDGSTAASLTSANYSVSSGAVNGDVISSLSYPTSGTYATQNAGTGISVSATGVSVASATTSAATGSKPVYGYTVSGGSASGNIGVITPANLTITAIDLAQAFTGQAFYGGNGIKVVGLVNGETVGVLAGQLAYLGTSQGAINPGAYSLLASGLSSGNYKISYVGGTLAIAQPVFDTVSPAPSSVLVAMTPSTSTLVMPGVSDSSDSSTKDSGNGANSGGAANTQSGTGQGAGGPGDGAGPGNGAGQGLGEGANKVVLEPYSTSTSGGSGANVDGAANTQPGTGQGAGGPGDGSGPGNGAGQGLGEGPNKTPDASLVPSSGTGANVDGGANTQPGTGQGAGGPGDGSGPGNGAGQGKGDGPNNKGSESTTVPATDPSSENKVQPSGDRPTDAVPSNGGSGANSGTTSEANSGSSSGTNPGSSSGSSSEPSSGTNSGSSSGSSSSTSSSTSTSSDPSSGSNSSAGTASGSSSGASTEVSSSPSSSGQQASSQSVESSGNSGAATTAPAANASVDSASQRLVTYEDISVSLVREVKPQAKGLVTVLVPKEIMTTGEEFSFKLPEKISAAAKDIAALRVTTESGGALPAWLEFDPGTSTVVSLSSSKRVFPLKLLIWIGNQRADLVISERTNQN